MAAVLNGTTDYFSTGAFITAAPYTFGASVNPDALTAAQYIVSIHKAAADTSNIRYRVAGEVANDPIRGGAGEGGTQDAASTSTSCSATTWQKATMVSSGVASRAVRLDNAGLNTGTLSVTPTGLDTGRIGLSSVSGSNNGFFQGKLANIIVWNTDLAAADLAKHQANYDPWFIQRANIKLLATLAGDAVDKSGNFTLTTNGTPTFTTSPGVITPRPWI